METKSWTKEHIIATAVFTTFVKSGENEILSKPARHKHDSDEYVIRLTSTKASCCISKTPIKCKVERIP